MAEQFAYLSFSDALTIIQRIERFPSQDHYTPGQGACAADDESMFIPRRVGGVEHVGSSEAGQLDRANTAISDGQNYQSESRQTSRPRR